jgi:hypothetical protein
MCSWRDSSDCRPWDENTSIVLIKYPHTHSAIANSVNPFQVVIVNEKHVAVRRTLRSPR